MPTVNETKLQWFNPHRYPVVDEMSSLCDTILTVVTNFESNERCPYELRRQRPRFDTASRPDKTNFKLLVESFVCDLTHTHLLYGDQFTLVNRTDRVLAAKSRYRPTYFGRNFKHLIDILADPSLDLIEQIKGEQRTETTEGFTTMIKPTDRFIGMMDKKDLNLDSMARRPDEEIVVLRDSRKGADSDFRDRVDYPETDDTRALRADVRSINDYLEGADITFDSDALKFGEKIDPTNRRLSRYYTYSSFDMGGRLFGGWWQMLSRDTRQAGIKLDGEKTVSLDYSQMALRLTYASLGVAPSDDDGYTLPHLEKFRPGVKKLFNAMLFPRPASWRLSVPRRIKRLLPDSWTDRQLIDAVKRQHPELESVWYTDIGHRTQNVESNILVKVLLACQEIGISALPIHDAIMVPESRAEAAQAIMENVFEDTTGLIGLVETE